ncbi:MAG: beta-xylosidase [Verrucomicrobiae bacterium]|nr:beta-xylosidase [Verrucomicrobiae bacterium]
MNGLLRKLDQGRINKSISLLLGVGLGWIVLASGNFASAAEPFPVTIRVEADKSLGELRQIWRFFGADEPNYATMKDGQKLLADFGSLRPGEVYFRAHNLLTSGDGTPALKWGSTDVYSEDEHGNPVYDWKILDLMFDSYLERGVRPYAQIGFMPQALSTHPEPYRHEWRPGLPYNRIFTGWSYPPKDYDKWSELVCQWVRHCVERYGEAEVKTWYWETWNEANSGNADRPGYFTGTDEEFNKLHDYAIAGVKRALPDARVGGPDSAGSGGDWTRAFLEHCLRGTNYATGEMGTPLDFVSFHAKGSPEYIDDHIRMGIARQLRTVDDGFGIVASYPELRNTPIVIGESDPEGCAACQGSRFSYRNGTMYSSYTAASFARKQDLADRHGVNFEGALTWAFTFENQPYFAGFRQLASCGIPLPVFNVFRMFSKMSGDRIRATSSNAISLDNIMRNGVREAPDVAAFASYDQKREQMAVMVWHYHDDDLPGPDALVELDMAGFPAGVNQAKLSHYRIDEDHSNAYALWLAMGSPVAPNSDEYDALLQSSELTPLEASPKSVALQNHTAKLSFSLPRQGVSLILLDWQ